MNTKIEIGKAVSGAFAIFKKNAVLLIVTMLICSLVSSVTAEICLGGMLIGYFAICLRLIDNDAKKPEIGDIFKGFSFILPGLVFSIVGELGWLVCGIGLLVTLPVSFWAMMLVAEKPEMSMGDALKESFDLIFKKKMWGLVLLGLVVEIIATLGFVLCIVGCLATVPLAFLILVCAYRQVYPKA